jgi:hypothetical protein
MKMRRLFLMCVAVVLVTTGFSRAELIQHLDATVSGSVSGNPVTQWADQSGSANDATPAVGSVYYPSTSLSASGLAGLEFGDTQNALELFSAGESDSWLDFSATGAAKDNTGFTVLVAFKCDSLNTGDWNELFGNTSTVSANGFGLRYSNTGVISAYLGNQQILRSLTGDQKVAAGDTIVYCFNYNASNGVFALWDSKNNNGTNKTTTVKDFSLTSAVTLGSLTTASRYIKGMVGEVKVYDSWMDITQLTSEREALVAKWVAVPEPATLALFAFGGLLLKKRH